ncbi:APC family permease [Blastococcus sp. BMG 814]|uniref:APC family permease n=1 Tax=Blastococcus carthaginiensis TaxID=3050034 RepID=A0ABT9IBC2_9ACTN|nr:APC family permease [Blastococcus carthaginiensis]MDP5182532.1 APC family permease [Blastococcus carthaginiensis]
MSDPTRSATGMGDPGHTQRGGRLRAGSLTAPHVVFMVLAAAAPMAVVVAIMPIAFALGNGAGTPGMYLLAALVLLLFSIGYVRAVPYVRNAGAFYAYIAQGLGRPLGLVAAYTAAICYNALSAATCGALAFFAADTANRMLGVDLPWPFWAAIGIALVLLLSYRRITVSARVLTVALSLEVFILLVLVVGILFQAGPSAFSFEVFMPTAVASGSIGVAVIYALSSFLGFEGTAIYAEETRDPVRTVPRATYGAVAVVGVFYVLCAWGLAAGAGVDRVGAVAGEDPGSFVFAITDQYLGSWAVDVIGVLVVVSSFAAVLAFHNAAARYFYALARDGFLPAPLARTHPRYGSPYVAGISQVVVLAVLVFGFALAGLDPLLNLATAMTGFGAVGLESLLTLTSLAIVVFFWRQGRRDFGHVIAPAIASVALAVATILSFVNYQFLTGSDSSIINSLPWLHLVTLVVGLALAFLVRRRDPERYSRMGSTPVEEKEAYPEQPLR